MVYVPRSDAGISSLEELRRYVDDELLAIAKELEAPVGVLQFVPLATGMSPRTKISDGMIVYAQAGVFGPNAGFYERVGGSWAKL
jgi:hypothetical protein